MIIENNFKLISILLIIGVLNEKRFKYILYYIMKYIFIDIRKSDEVYSKRFGLSNAYSTYNIPMNMIRFNVENIMNHLNYVDVIYIVCQSGSRSKFIKDKYFSNYENIKVNKNLQFKNLNIGNNDVKLSENENIDASVIGDEQFNLYSIARIIQFILGISIILLGGYTYFMIFKTKKYNTVPLIILILLGVMALINGLTSTCTISNVLINYLN